MVLVLLQSFRSGDVVTSLQHFSKPLRRFLDALEVEAFHQKVKWEREAKKLHPQEVQKIGKKIQFFFNFTSVFKK